MALAPFAAIVLVCVGCSVSEVPTRTQSLRNRHQMSEDTEQTVERGRRGEGEPVGPSLQLR